MKEVPVEERYGNATGLEKLKKKNKGKRNEKIGVKKRAEYMVSKMECDKIEKMKGEQRSKMVDGIKKL
jgi:hypothetical protein